MSEKTERENEPFSNEPFLIDDRPTWKRIQQSNAAFRSELEAKYGRRPDGAQNGDHDLSHSTNQQNGNVAEQHDFEPTTLAE